MKKCFFSLSLLVAMGGALSTVSIVSSCSDDKVTDVTPKEQDKEENIVISGADGEPVTSATINANEEIVLTANQEVSWEVTKGEEYVELEKVPSGTKSAVTATSVKVMAKKTGTATITATSLKGNNQLAEFVIKVKAVGYVDLGLKTEEGKPIYWAKCNIGATKPEEFGYYYGWGEVSIYYDSTKWKGDTAIEGSKKEIWKSGYSESLGYAGNSNKWCEAEKCFSKYIVSNENGITGNPGYDGKNKLEPCDDVAYQLLGEDWRMPDSAEYQMLKNNCYWEWTDNYNNNTNVKGCVVYKVKNDNDKGVYKKPDGSYKFPTGITELKGTYSLTDDHIFIPFAGMFSLRYFLNSNGCYWSSSLNLSNPQGAYHFDFTSNDNVIVRTSYRYYGYPVRAVYVSEE